jgi:hypothetical protein
MKYINIELSEIDIIGILNSLSYFRNEIMWHDSVDQKRRIAMYFNFKDNDEFLNQYDLIDNLHKRISLQANKEMYNKINEYFFIGQQKYLVNKDYKFIYSRHYENNETFSNNKKIKNVKNNKFRIFIFKTLDKLKSVV